MIEALRERFRTRLSGRNAFKQVLLLASGNAAAQAVTILAAPILARIYTPEDYGVSGVFSSTLLLLGGFATMRYGVSITTAPTDETSIIARKTAWLVGIIVSIIIAAACWTFAPEIAGFLHLPTVWIVSWVIPIAFVGVMMRQVSHYALVRERKFRVLSGTSVTTSLVSVTVQLCTAGLGGAMLLLGSVIGQWAGSLHAWWGAKTTRAQGTWSDVRGWALQHWRLPVFMVPQGIAYSIGTNGLPLALAIGFSSTEAGWFALAYRLVTVPVNAVGQALSAAFLSRVSVAYDEGRLGHLVWRLGRMYLRVGLPLAAIASVTTPTLIKPIFGEGWEGAKPLIMILIPASTAAFLANALTNVIFPLREEKVGAAREWILLLSRAGAVWWGINTSNLVWTVAAYATASIVMHVGFMFWVERAIGSERWLLPEGIRGLCWGASIAAPMLITETLGAWIWWGWIGSLSVFFCFILLNWKQFWRIKV